MIPTLTSPAPLLAATAVLAYLAGSVSFGLLMARAFRLGDLRKVGSGNIGATNVLRTGNRMAAFLTLALDAAKGAAAVLAARAALGEDAAQVAALSAFVGHCFPAWHGFRGGKGVATFLGVTLALNPLLGLAACAIWVTTAWLTRISSLSALVAAAATPLLAPPIVDRSLVVLSLALAAIVFLRHAANIRRLMAGTEPRIGGKG